MDQTPLLKATEIRKAFQVGDRQLEVLHGVNIELMRGEILGLMGPSGAGKTTLLNIVGLLDNPTEGEVLLEGSSAWKLSQEERSKLRNRLIGFVFQFYHLLPELSAVENAILPAMIAHGSRAFRKRKKDYVAKAEEMLRGFGLENRLRHRPGQMSGGEQQRVAIARALLLDPPMLIADEPTGNLDRATGEKVLEIIFEEQQKRSLALLIVTHDERLAQRCERVVYIDDGIVQGDSVTPIPH